MERHRPCIALVIVLLFGPALVPRAEQADQLIVRGRVAQVHAPRLFTVEDDAADRREWLVLVPRAVSTPVSGATVEVRGALRRADEPELKGLSAWNEIDQRTRDSFAGRQVLIASSLIATPRGEFLRRAAEASPAQALNLPFPNRKKMVLTVRPATLVEYIDELAGRQVRIPDARVVGLFEPRAFLIESATRYQEFLGHRDRVLVLVDAAALRVPAESIVASTVTVVGVARTLLGVKVTGEVPWPAKLDPERVERLEVRAAVLATSVQTAEGTELTDRPATSQPPER